MLGAGAVLTAGSCWDTGSSASNLAGSSNSAGSNLPCSSSFLLLPVGRKQFMKFEWANRAADVLGCELEELTTTVFKHHLKQIIAQATARGGRLPPEEDSPSGAPVLCSFSLYLRNSYFHTGYFYLPMEILCSALLLPLLWGQAVPFPFQAVRST